MKDEHVNDAAQGVVEDVPQDVAQDLGFRARAARALLATPPPPPPCLCAVRAEMGAQLGSSVAFGSGCGQTLPGVPRKAPLCLSLIVKRRSRFNHEILTERRCGHGDISARRCANCGVGICIGFCAPPLDHACRIGALRRWRFGAETVGSSV